MVVVYLSPDTVEQLRGLGPKVQLNAPRALRALEPLHAEAPSWSRDVLELEEPSQPDLLVSEVPKWATDIEWLTWKRRQRVLEGAAVPRRTDLCYEAGVEEEQILSDLAEKIAPKFARDEAWLTWLEGARKRLKTAKETAARKGNRGGRLNAEEAALLSSLAGGGPPSRAQEMEDIQKTVREGLRRKAAEKGDRGERLNAEEAALLAALEDGGSSPPAREMEEIQKAFQRNAKAKDGGPLQGHSLAALTGETPLVCVTIPRSLQCLYELSVQHQQRQRKEGHRGPLFYPAEWHEEKTSPPSRPNPPAQRGSKRVITFFYPNSKRAGVRKLVETTVETAAGKTVQTSVEELPRKYLKEPPRNREGIAASRMLRSPPPGRRFVLDAEQLGVIQLVKDDATRKFKEEFRDYDFSQEPLVKQLYEKITELKPLQELIEEGFDGVTEGARRMMERALELNLAYKKKKESPEDLQNFLNRLLNFIKNDVPRTEQGKKRERQEVSADPGASAQPLSLIPLHRRAATVLYWDLGSARRWDLEETKLALRERLEEYLRLHRVDVFFCRERLFPDEGLGDEKDLNPEKNYRMKQSAGWLPAAEYGMEKSEHGDFRLAMYWKKTSPDVELLRLLGKPPGHAGYSLVGGRFRVRDGVFSVSSLATEEESDQHHFDPLFSKKALGRPEILAGSFAAQGSDSTKAARYALEAYHYRCAAGSAAADGATGDFFSFDPRAVGSIGGLAKLAGSEELANGHRALCARFFLQENAGAERPR